MTFFVLSEFLYQLLHWPLCDYQYHFFGNTIYIVQHIAINEKEKLEMLAYRDQT